ncbi:ABC transporter substrate-binding protein [Rhizosaccharibacter radicis]|uniref:ABC transporter substrate-binding protein n=1 Tax=Rhizosaccharibacter radicis TaxID=2782605 RepID=A0ABT1W0X3_9PROT|nr:ABC transporter substrate-binding protein [Acetobacteraceae bacterium KSS12]
MRRAALIAVAALLTATVLGGCRQKRAAADQASRSGAPRAGGTLVYATDREPLCLDPHVLGDMPQVFLARQYLDSLVSMDATGTIRPWLAESWQISADKLSYRFELRHDVRFTDGTPFDAAALKANLDHIVDPATQSSTAGGYIRQYAGTDIVGPFTAVVHLSSPYAAFLQVLAQGFLGMESPAALRRGRDANCQHPVGSGPFRVERWDHQSRVVLDRNPDYRWAPPIAAHQGPAWLDRVEWRFIPEASVRFGSLQAGEVDVIDGLPPEDETPAGHNPDLWVLIADRPGNPTNGTLNIRRPPFDDIRVREAFIRSCDIDAALASVFFKHYRHAGGPLSPSTPDYSPDFEHSKDFDPARAARLLDEAGWHRGPDGIRMRDGQRLVVHVPIRMSMSAADRSLWEQVQATTRDAGFDTRLEPGPDTAVIAREFRWDYDMRLGYWNTNTPDVLRIVFSSASNRSISGSGRPGPHQNTSGFADPAFDAVVQKALATDDPAERRALYHDAQARIAAAQLQVTTYPQTTRLAIRRDVHGVSIEPSLGVSSLYDAWINR